MELLMELLLANGMGHEMEQTLESHKHVHATGKVIKAFGNLLQVEFEGDIRQGEVVMVHVENVNLKAEVIEIVGNAIYTAQSTACILHQTINRGQSFILQTGA